MKPRNEMKRKTNDLTNSTNAQQSGTNTSNNTNNNNNNNNTEFSPANAINNFYQKLQQQAASNEQQQQQQQLGIATDFAAQLLRNIQSLGYLPASTPLLTPSSANNGADLHLSPLPLLQINPSQPGMSNAASANHILSLASFVNNNNNMSPSNSSMKKLAESMKKEDLVNVSPSFLSKSLPASLTPTSSMNPFDASKQSTTTTVFNFPPPIVASISTLLAASSSSNPPTPNLSPQMSRDESSIPLKKRVFTSNSQEIGSQSSNQQQQLLANMSPSVLFALASLNKTASEFNLSDWLKQRVLALCLTTSNNNNNIIKRSNSEESLSEEPISTNFIQYIPATIQSVNGALVTVAFELLESSISAQNKSFLSDQQYDVSKDGQKYAVIEDAAPQADQLDKGLLVLYRHQSVSLSHPSTPTPTTPTSPPNSNINNNNKTTANEFRYRLGRIIDTRDKKKYFLIQPINYAAATASFSSLADSSAAMKDTAKSSILVARPNLRLITPPWYSEYTQELDLKHFKDVQLNVIFPIINNNNSSSSMNNNGSVFRFSNNDDVYAHSPSSSSYNHKMGTSPYTYSPTQSGKAGGGLVLGSSANRQTSQFDVDNKANSISASSGAVMFHQQMQQQQQMGANLSSSLNEKSGNLNWVKYIFLFKNG